MKTILNNTKGIFKRSSIVLIVAVAFFAASCEEEEMTMAMTESQEFVDIPSTLDIMNENPDMVITSDMRLKADDRVPFDNAYFKTLTAALQKTNLMGTVARNTLTLFAPTDMAFERLFADLGVKGLDDLTAEALTPILLYHAVSGSVLSGDLSSGYYTSVNGASIQVNLGDGVMVNKSNVIIADIPAVNGVIHAIDKVMLPPSLVDLALGNSNFSILVEAVVKADLVETLASGEFTVFAPTNDAFLDLLGELGYSSLDEIPVNLLKDVLLYHVLPAKVYSNDLPARPYNVKTVHGQIIEIDATVPEIKDVKSRKANLIGFDVSGTNGVIHVIDKVVLPHQTALSR
jgi:transforming growth factor-beta-induced protein